MSNWGYPPEPPSGPPPGPPPPFSDPPPEDLEDPFASAGSSGTQGPPGQTPPPPGWAPLPPPPPPSRRPKRVRFAVIVAGLVVISFGVIAAIVAVTAEEGDEEPKAAEPSETTDPTEEPTKDPTPTEPPKPTSWSVPRGTTAGWTYTTETWLYGNLLVRATDVGVDAYDRATGKRAWHLDVPTIKGVGPKVGIKYCGASGQVSGDLVALAYGPASGKGAPACDVAQVVNLKTGERVWDRDLVRPKKPVDSPEGVWMEFSGSTLVVGWSASQNTVVGVAAKTGKEAWRVNDQKKLFGDRSCTLADVAPRSGSVLAVATCAGDTKKPTSDIAITHIGAAKGSVAKRAVTTEKQIGFRHANLSGVPSTPLMLTATNADQGGDTGDHVLVVDEAKLQVRAVTSPKQGWTLLSHGWSEGNRSPMGVTYGDGMVVTTSATDLNKKSPLTALVAFDQKTGKQKWGTMFGSLIVRGPIGIDGDEVLVWLSGDGESRVGRVKLATGKVVDRGSPLKETPIDLGAAGTRPGVWRSYTGGWLYAVTTHPGAGNPEIAATKVP